MDNSPAGKPDAALVRSLRRAAVRAAAVCVAIPAAFLAADGSLLPARAWLALAIAAGWFALGAPRVRAACRAGARRQVSRRVALHFLPLAVLAAAAPVLAALR